MAMDLNGRHYRVAILGAGFSGMAMGIALLRSNRHDFVIVEKADDLGGTWRENRYPGIACDVPSHLYSFSFELNPEWRHNYAEGGEIWSYMQECAEKYGLHPHLSFESRVDEARFDGERWQIALSDGRSFSADLVVSGLGGLHEPNHAAIEGREEFAGPRFHTADWRDDVELAGKRVALIGTGASGVQVLPAIAPTVSSVTVFQRSAAWVFPRFVRDIPERTRDRFRRFPWLMRLYRWFLWAFMDVFGMLTLRRGGLLAGRMKKVALSHLENSVADPELRARLTPDYAPGCKRRCVSDDYWTTFNRENVHLVTDPITRIEPRGVRDASGMLHEVDVIVEATGFKPFNVTDYVSIIGRDERSLADHWAERVESFRTVMAPGFPNFFLLLGPNSATGHTSALIMIESASEYVVKALDHMDRTDVSHLDPDPSFVSGYNAKLQTDMKGMVFSGGCNAWYTDANDFNFTLWPHSAARFVRELKRFRPEEFRPEPRSAGS